MKSDKLQKIGMMSIVKMSNTIDVYGDFVLTSK